MHLLDLTLPTPEENLALDEALLETAEAAPAPCESLRLWESPRSCVVIGRSSQRAAEVRLDACRELGIPVLRRGSGGAAVVAGPGCLMYALVLSYDLRPELRPIDEAHRFVLGTICRSLESSRHTPCAVADQTADGTRSVPATLACAGTSDLTLDGCKFSGNSMRCKRTHFLYHGTLLYDFPLDLIERCLAMPPRQPEYRLGRSHERFVANLPASAAELRAALVAGWKAEPLADWPRELTAQLVASRYSQAAWNERL